MNIEAKNKSLKVLSNFNINTVYEKEKNGRGGNLDTLWCGRNSKRIKYVTGISSEWAGGGTESSPQEKFMVRGSLFILFYAFY